MLLSLNWLKDFVDIPNKVTPKELGNLLTLHTVEVERVEKQGRGLDGVRVGEILSIRKHVNADKLSVAQVDVGEKKPRQIVFGKMVEMKVGVKVPVALAPTTLPDGKEIKSVDFRGEKSEGMLCLDQEIGLLKEGVSIQFFDKKVKNGTPITKAMKLDDIILEVDNKSITHRSDLWSHYGLARDISAFLQSEFHEYKANLANLRAKLPEIKINVKVEDYELCPRYMALGISGIKISESPDWLKARLTAAGSRPINNIVDITNYVLLELGQPLHAFDEKLIRTNDPPAGGANKSECKIIVRRAKDGEIMETLDGVKRKLEPDMLVIANSHKPMAIAGVMGGTDSGINEATTSIIIEAANFNYNSIRRTSRRLGLRTEASMRYEKGLDPNLAELGLIRAVELIKKICPGARVASNLVDLSSAGDGAKNFKALAAPIELDLLWLSKFIGHDFSAGQVKQILTKLGFIVLNDKKNKNIFKVSVPTWRSVADVSAKEDLAEEIARIYGFNNLEAGLPKMAIIPPDQDGLRLMIKKIKNILSVGAHFSEVYNYSFLSEVELLKIKIEPDLALRLANPLSQDLALLRPSLIPGLLRNVKDNQAREEIISLFEVGNIFLNSPGDMHKESSGQETLPFQEKRLALVMAGLEPAELPGRFKGVLSFLFNTLELAVGFEPAETQAAWAQGGSAASIIYQGRVVGQLAILDKNIARSLGLKKAAVAAEISLNELNKLAESRPLKQYIEPPIHPLLNRDLAFVVNEKILYNNIKNEIISFDALVKRVELFDVFTGGKLGAGQKSLAFHIYYGADRTLTSEEVDVIQEKLIKHLEDKFDAKVRDF